MAATTWIGASGSQAWDDTGNWDTGSVPVDGDDVYILAGTSTIDTNINQSGVTLASLTIGMGFTGTIGTASLYLQIGATLWVIGVPVLSGLSGAGSPRIKIDFGSVQFTGAVQNTCQSTADTGLEPLRIIGTHASNSLSVLGGRVGVATTFPSEVATLLTVLTTGGVVNLGPGCTLTTVTNNGGIGTSNSAITTLRNSAGTWTTQGSGKVTTIYCGAQTNLNHRTASGASIDTLSSLSGGTANLKGNPASLIITNTVLLYEGSSFVAFSPSQVQSPGPAELVLTCVECGVDDVNIQVGDNPTLTIT